MLNRKIIVVPKIERRVDFLVASPEFLDIRPKNLQDSYYITGVFRTDIMLKYMYSKTPGGTPSRYRLSVEDFKELDFPIATEKDRKQKAVEFGKSLSKYHETITSGENQLTQSHQPLELDI